MTAKILPLAFACAVFGVGCSKSHSPAYLAKLSGDGQVGLAGDALPAPLVVKSTDMEGNPASGVSVIWSVMEGDGQISSAKVITGDDGTASITATLGATATRNRFSATTYGLFGSPVVFESTHSPFKLAYADPATGGKLRLVKNSESNDTAVTLDLVVAPGASLTGYSTGFNLPVDDSKIALDAMTPMRPGKALDAGSEPPAAMAMLPKNGPLKGVLVTGQSQKSAGKGAIATDTKIADGSVLYSIKLTLVPTATPGVIFDGTAAGFVLPSGGLRDRQGTAVVNASDVKIGKLEVVK